MRIQNLILAASLVASTAVAVGCGDSGLAETEVPQITLDPDTPDAVALSLGAASNRPTSQTPIRFRNSGEADLEVTSVRWEAKPERLIGAGEYTGVTCDYDVNAGSTFDASGTCPTDTFCWALTNECRERGLDETPFTVPVGQLHQISTVILPGEGEVVCPEAPTDREVPTNYCGELVIETNANNDGPSVTDGTLRVFFTFNAGSGAIDVTPSSINFVGVGPGGSDSRELNVTNTADEGALEINQVRIQDHEDMFSISGPSGTTELEPGSTQTWTVEFNAPEDWDEQTIGTNVEIRSSGTNEQTTLIPVTVSSQQDRPVIKIDPTVLRFNDGNSQTLTISNEGSASLVMQSFSAGSAYSFSIDGETFSSEVPSDHRVVQAGNSKDVTVTYNGSSGDGVDNLEISYVYYVGEDAVSETANVTLLGSLGDAPVGLIAPDSFLLLAEAGNNQTRSFVVRNVGTQPLDITAATLSEEGGDFSVVGDPTGQIAAGELKEISVEYNGSDAQMDNVTLTLESNTAGEAMSVLLFAQPGTAEGDTEAQITPSFADDTTAVDAEARFSARQSTVSDTAVLDSTQWVLLSRPAGSSAFVQKTGADISFFPDVAGEYKLSALVTEASGASSQAIYTFTAQ